MSEVPQTVIDFVLETIPRGMLRTYSELAQLKYPITDRKSLLASAPGDKEEAGLIRAIWAKVFTVHDFPLESPQSALEKFNDGLPSRPRAGRPRGSRPRTAARMWQVGPVYKPPWEWSDVGPQDILDWFNCADECEREYLEGLAEADPHDAHGHLRDFAKMIDCQRACWSTPIPGGSHPW